MKKPKFKDMVPAKGLKSTKERNEILNAIIAIKGHFDPNELYCNLKAKGSSVSRASVYRTIPILLDGGVIEKVEKVDRHAHYELVSKDKHHDHMICTKCGKVIEFYSPTLEMLQDELCRNKKFTGIRHTLEIFGLCRECG